MAPHLVTTEQELREVVSYFMAHLAFVLDVETTIAPDASPRRGAVDRPRHLRQVA